MFRDRFRVIGLCRCGGKYFYFFFLIFINFFVVGGIIGKTWIEDENGIDEIVKM